VIRHTADQTASTAPSGTRTRRLRRRYTAPLATAVAAGSILGTMALVAPSASAYSVITKPVSCSAVRVHKTYSTSSTVVGIGYRGDHDRISLVKYNSSPPNMENSWLYGTITRRSDGARVTGWVVSSCINLRA
jgi:hypothetical protein